MGDRVALGLRRRAGRARAPRRVVLAGLLAAALLVGAPLRSSGQIAVYDSSVFTQTVLEAARMLEMVNLMVRDLAPFTQLGLALQLVAEIQGLMTEVEGIASAMQGRRALWASITTVPSTARELASFRVWATGICRESTQQGLQAQSLIARATRLLTTLTTMLQTVEQIVGSVAGLQHVTVMLGNVSGHLVLLQTMLASSHEAQMCDAWSLQIRQQAMRAITERALSDFGVMR